MIITRQKPFSQILDSLNGYNKIFLIGCGECSTTCKTGGLPELEKMQQELQKQSKAVLGIALPTAPCIAGKIKIELAKNTAALKASEAILVLACGLGVQSVKDNDRFGLPIFPACDTICAAVMDGKGGFYEKCSMCNDCVLGLTCGICPITLCAKGLLNGPCGGMNKGKCEVDSQQECAWVMIYKELDKRKKLQEYRKILPAKDFKKMTKPHKINV